MGPVNPLVRQGQAQQPNPRVTLMTPPQGAGQQPMNQMQFLSGSYGLGPGQPSLMTGTGVMPFNTPTGIGQGFLNWDQALAGAMGQDLANQQGAANQMYEQLAQSTAGFGQALQQGLGTVQSVGAQQQQALQGIAGSLEQKGQAGYEDFLKFRDQQMSGVNKEIATANQQMAGAVSGFQQAIKDFKDTSAQDAANAAFGLHQNAQSRMAEIDMLDASPGEKAALKQQLTGDVSNQVTQTVTGIFGQMNQFTTNLESNLAGLRQAQAGQTLAGGQLMSQTGLGYGAQTLDAQRMNQQMSELGANLRVMGEQAYASAMNQAVVMDLQGRKDMAEMIRSNPRQFMSMFAGLTGYLAAATTPNINQISVPNFGVNG
jgi:hypothetical protein